MKRIQLILIILCVCFKGNASVQPEIVVKSFGENLSSWCSTNNISYREKIDALCSGNKSCRVEDKIHAEYQKKRGLTNFETFVLDSYMNMFQALISKNVEYQMSNVKVETTDMMPDGQLTFVTADIKVSGPINYTVTDLFLVREGKITGIYNYSSQLGFSHLNGSLIRALKVGRYMSDADIDFGFGGYFDGGYAKIRNEAGNCGLIDIHGNVIIPCIWAEIFYRGGAFATGTDAYGKIMKTYDLRFDGKVVPTVNYFADGQTSNCFIDGYMKVASNNGTYGFLKETDFGYDVKFKYDWVTDFCDGYALVGKNESSFIIDKSFKVVLQSNENYEICSCFHEGLAKVKDRNSNNHGFVNVNGELIIPCKFKGADDFSDGLCAVYSEGDKYMGFINKQGNVVIPIIYEAWDGRVRWPHYFKDGYTSIRKKNNNEMFGTLLGKNGEPLQGFPWRYKEVYCLKENKARFIENGKWGFLNQNGNVVVPAKYDFESDYINGYATVQVEVNGVRKWGAINHDGVMVVPCIYDNEVVFYNGIALVFLEGQAGLIDVYGNSSFFKKTDA